MKIFRSLRSARQKREALPVRRAAETYSAPSDDYQFRRNRTISGIKQGQSDQSERQRAHHLSKLRRRIGLIFGGFIMVFAGTVFLASQYTAEVDITFDTVTSVKTDDISQYTERVNAYFSANPFERFRFLTNAAALLQFVQQSFPEVSAMTPNGISSLGTGIYTFSFRQPIASWDVDGKSYFVDTDGVGFVKNYFPRPSVTIIDSSGIPTGDVTVIASSRLLSFAGRVVAVAKQQGVIVTKIEIPAGSIRQVNISVEGKKSIVYMTTDREVGEQVTAMRLALQTLDETAPGYIDVRTAGKAIYR